MAGAGRDRSSRVLVSVELPPSEKVRLLQSRFPHPPRPELEPPNRLLVAAVAAELRRRGGRWAYLPNWVFWPTIRRIAWKGDTFDEAWAWARRRMVKAALEAGAPAEVQLGPCLLWEPIPHAVRRPAWLPPPATLGEIRAKPGVPARVYTWNEGKNTAKNASNRVRTGQVDELPPSEWIATPRVLGNPDVAGPVLTALWLTYDRRRKDVPVDNDRRKR